jgi:hypothetical protein
MLLVIGFHLTVNFDISHSENGGTFYEINNTKVSTPLLSFQNLHFADLATFEKEEKEEKTESEPESHFDLTLESNKFLSVRSFFLISGAAGQSLKIPSLEGKAALYILFKNFRVHLA